MKNTRDHKHIWELDPHMRCPVVGALLSETDHKKILKKCGYPVKKMKPYEMHQIIMENLSSDNQISVKTDHLIMSKSRKIMREIQDLTDSEIRELWKKRLHDGNIGPLFYSILSADLISLSLLHDVYGDVHMLAHANMQDLFEMKRTLTKSEETNRILKQKDADTRDHYRKRMRELTESNDRLKKKNLKLISENTYQKAEIQRLTQLVHGKTQKIAETVQIEPGYHEIESKLKKKEQDLLRFEREKRSMQIQIFDLETDKESLVKELEGFTSQFSASVTGCSGNNDECIGEECPQYELCAKNIFMVGGITKMKHLYKDIVEKSGGFFDYHDGYMKRRNSNLEARIKRSDLVLCPVNCNSHNACLQIKKLCNRYNKTLKIMHSSSLSAVSDAVFVKPENNSEASFTTLN